MNAKQNLGKINSLIKDLEANIESATEHNIKLLDVVVAKNIAITDLKEKIFNKKRDVVMRLEIGPQAREALVDVFDSFSDDIDDIISIK